MLALFLFAVVGEDVDEFSAAAVEDMEEFTTLDKVAVAAEALAADDGEVSSILGARKN